MTRRAGIFQGGQISREGPIPLELAAARSPNCGACGLYLTCQTPKMPVAGHGRRGILIIGEAPGKDDDERGAPFTGQSGELVRRALDRFGVDMHADCWRMNALSCRPERGQINDEKMIDHCRPKVLRAVHELRPKMILLLGGRAVRSLLGWLWKDSGEYSTARWAGWRIPSTRLNAWVCPTYHPSFVARQDARRGEAEVVQRLFEGHVGGAVERSKDRPYPHTPPEPRDRIQAIIDPARAVYAIDALVTNARFLAYDTESDRLKPWHRRSRLITCALSGGEDAVAYPWTDATAEATRRALHSGLPVVAWNAKHDEQWMYRHLGVMSDDLAFDPMIAAHILDGRERTKSLKFQAFVRLGVDSYDDSLSGYMESADKSANGRNRLHEVSLKKLLEYNALDALHTADLARVLAPQVGVRLG